MKSTGAEAAKSSSTEITSRENLNGTARSGYLRLSWFVVVGMVVGGHGGEGGYI